MIATCFFHTELEYIWGQHAKLLHTVHHMSNHFHLLHLLTFPATRIYNHIWTNKILIPEYVGNSMCYNRLSALFICVPVHVSIKVLCRHFCLAK